VVAVCRYSLRPRVLVDVSRVSTATSILQGRIHVASPIVVAPFTNAKAAHAAGEKAVAAAAAAAGTAYCVPHYANFPLPEVCAAAGGADRLLFQLYPVKKLAPTSTGTGAGTSPSPSPSPSPSAGANLAASGIVSSSAADPGLDRGYTALVLAYVARLGFRAVALTVDAPNNANRERTYKSAQVWFIAVEGVCL
jgi:isopentenyl diphosphate isomerase/L-lactate dehydrogenase-like FMN-dependent dehydrogenase